MAIPFLVWGAAAALAATGVKKGLDAKEDFAYAERIGEKAKKKHENAIESLNKEKELTNDYLIELGRLKQDVFSNQFKYLVDFTKKIKESSEAKLEDFEEEISSIDIQEMENLVTASLELDKTLGSSAIGGALAGIAAYGGVGMLASASTGTAIATLSGAAAKSATLAWLGGGSLATGGFGIAGGTLALGGVVLGPALAIGGFMMASKAEEAVTDAKAYRDDVDVKVADIEKTKIHLKGLRSHSVEMSNVIKESVARFESVKTNDITDDKAIKIMFTMGKSLKELLKLPIIDKEENLIPNLRSTYSGLLIYNGQ